MTDETNPTDLIKWDTITADNEEDPIKQIMDKNLTTKKNPRGRPRKSNTPVEAPAEPIRMQELLPKMEISTPESLIPTQNLVNMFRRSKSQSPPKQRGLRFSADVENEESQSKDEDPERATLLKMYKQYFREPLIRKHTRKEKSWTERHKNSDIFREIRELENLVSEDDPAGVLSGIWVHSMSVVEAVGPAVGLESQGLSEVSAAVAQRDDFRANMRELLLKYPYLRTMVGLGGYPELKLLLISATLIKEIHFQNLTLQQTRERINPDQPVPDNLKKAYSQI